jgi:hypothetical protein
VNDLTAAIWRRLRNDPIIAGLVAWWDGLPAIFTSSPVPESAGYPRILTEVTAQPSRFSTDALSGALQTRDIIIYGDVTGSAALIDMIARRVTDLFTCASLTMPDFEDWYATAAAPSVIGSRPEEDPDLNARLVRFRLHQSTVSASAVGFEIYEVPVKTPNGVITNFSTTREFISGSLRVWINSVCQRPGVDVAEDADLMGYTFNTGAPLAGSDLWHEYRYSI